MSVLRTALAATCIAIVQYAALASNAPQTHGSFRGCPAIGRGSDGRPPRDPELNKLKNRSIQVSQPAPFDIAELKDKLPDPSSALRKSRKSWSLAVRSVVGQYEALGAQIVGYLIDVKKEGPEQPNCSAPKGRGDFHMWLVDKKGQAKIDAAIVEVTPRWRAANPPWQYSALRQIVKKGALVRITGWLLFDQEHPEQLTGRGRNPPTRGTLWEIHPVTEVEVETPNGWIQL